MNTSFWLRNMAERWVSNVTCPNKEAHDKTAPAYLAAIHKRLLICSFFSPTIFTNRNYFFNLELFSSYSQKTFYLQLFLSDYLQF